MKRRATSIGCTLIAGLLGCLACNATAAEWYLDYGFAYRTARREVKPLLVVLEKPAEDRSRFEQVPIFEGDAALLSPYRLCRIDVTTAKGKKIAKLFGATEFPKIAITDSRVDQIVYEKTGKFTDSDWANMLATYRSGTDLVAADSPVPAPPPLALVEFESPIEFEPYTVIPTTPGICFT